MLKVSPTMKKTWKAWRGHGAPWVEYPLIAFAIVSIGPIVIALYRWGSGSVLWKGVSDYAVIALDNWPFLALYFVCRQRVREEWPSVRSIRLAMWISLVAMLLPNIPFFLPEGEGLYDDPFILAVFYGIWWAVIAIFGLIGWVTGRFAAWIIGLVIGET